MGISEQEYETLKRRLGFSALPTVAKAPVVRSGYRSKTEEKYAAYLDLMVQAREIRDWKYEAVTLKLAEGVRYTPDFIVRRWDGTPEGSPVFREIKGRKKESFWTMPVSRVKVRMAATLFPHWRFEIVWPGARLGEWSSMVVPSGKAEVR